MNFSPLFSFSCVIERTRAHQKLGAGTLQFPLGKAFAQVAGLQAKQVANVEKGQRPLAIVAKKPVFRIGE
jgi:hypothetical protein